MESEIVRLSDVHRHFDNGAVQALRGISLSVGAGEFVAIMGPSGCGKSTLLHLMGALDAPTSGTVRVAGSDLTEIRDLSRFRAHTVGFVFQSSHLLPTLTAVENVQMPMFEMGWPAAERRRRAVDLLRAVGLGHRLGHCPAHLSGGERQRVAIARSLANGPQLLLADEPTGNLDSGNAGEVVTLLESIHRERGMTLVVVTHEPAVAARAGRTVRMFDGRVLETRDAIAGA
jgi:ABC-type lipoprotein export system ATPase subunit